MTRLLLISFRARCVEVALYLLAGTEVPALVDELADVCLAFGGELGGGVS